MKVNARGCYKPFSPYGHGYGYCSLFARHPLKLREARKR